MEIYENLRDLAIIIAVAEVFGLIARKIKLPQVVGQIIAGLLIGPCVLGWAGNTEYIKIFAEVGVVLIMFSAGLGTNLKTLVKTGPVALLMATMGWHLWCLVQLLQWYSMDLIQSEARDSIKHFLLV